MDSVAQVEKLAGVDWRDIFASIAPATTARGLALALSPIAGGAPRVIDYAGYSEIVFTAEQEERLAAWLLTQLRKEPGPVRIATGSIPLRVVTRQYWPWVAGIALAGFLLGRVGK